MTAKLRTTRTTARPFQISLRITVAQRRRLESLALKNKTSVGQIIRQAIDSTYNPESTLS